MRSGARRPLGVYGFFDFSSNLDAKPQLNIYRDNSARNELTSTEIGDFDSKARSMRAAFDQRAG